jgi:tetratricopeptide (TPR) repeat protein
MTTKGNPGGSKGRPTPPAPEAKKAPSTGGKKETRRGVGVEGEAPAAIERSKKMQPRSLKEILGEEDKAPSVEAEENKKGGAKGWHPERVKQFLRGQITLGDLEGITKPEQYEMAKIGYSYLTSGKLDKAKTVFEGLIALDPYDAYFHTALGSIAQQQNQFPEAEARYSRALEINPFSPVARAHRGEIRVMTGRLYEGAEDLLRALQEDPQAREPSTVRARATLQAVKEQLQAANIEEVAKKAKEVTDAKVAAQKAAAAKPGPESTGSKVQAAPARPAVPRAAQPRVAPRASRPGPRRPVKK